MKHFVNPHICGADADITCHFEVEELEQRLENTWTINVGAEGPVLENPNFPRDPYNL